MRTLRIAVLAAGLVVLGAMPVGAVPPPPVTVAISPVGGTPGTAISVHGACASNEGDAYLERPIRSDAVPPPIDHVHFSASNGNYTTTLHNPLGSDGEGFPQDLNVRVWCANASEEAAFQASDSPMGTNPAIFASLGETPCGFFYLADPNADSRIPCPEHIKAFTAAGRLTTNFYRDFDDSSGASIAAGDVNGDGQTDIVSGSGRRAPGTVLVTKLDGTLIASAHVYGDFAGGVNVAVGDLNGDGHNEIVTGAGPGGGPHVLAFAFNATSASLDQVASFYAYNPAFHGGVRVAVGDSKIITGAGAGGGPHVKVFDGAGQELRGFYAYDPRFTGGVDVAAGPSQIVTGAGPGGGPHVRVFSMTGALNNAGWYAYDAAFSGGVSVAIGRVNGGEQIVTGAGPGGGPHVRLFNTDGTLSNGGWQAFDHCCPAGVRVAIAP